MRVRALAFICVSSVIYSITSSALAYLPWSSVVVGIFAFWLHSGRHFYILGLLMSLIIRFLFSLYTNTLMHARARTHTHTHTYTHYIYIYYKHTSNLHGSLTRRIVWTRAQDTTRYDFIVVPRARGAQKTIYGWFRSDGSDNGQIGRRRSCSISGEFASRPPPSKVIGRRRVEL